MILEVRSPVGVSPDKNWGVGRICAFLGENSPPYSFNLLAEFIPFVCKAEILDSYFLPPLQVTASF